MPDFLSKPHFLITNGRIKEVIDGVRFLTNHARPENHGYDVAKKLATEGMQVTLITANKSIRSMLNLHVINTMPDGKNILSAADLLNTCEHALNKTSFDKFIQLANISTLKPVISCARKLKVKSNPHDLWTLDVMGNIDVITNLKRKYPRMPVLGFNNFQECMNDQNFLNNHMQNLTEDDSQSFINNLPVITHRKLLNKKIIVTSGPTVELLTTHHDVLTNFSSGKQGYAIACALAAMGANVIFISGPTRLSLPKNSSITTHAVSSAQQMKEACFHHLPADALIAVAAVADFGLTKPLDLSLPENQQYALSLSQNPDILAEIGHHPQLRPPIVIGFAAETHDVIPYAKNKLIMKKADAICANLVGNTAHHSDENQISYLTSTHLETLPNMNKIDIGFFLGEKIADFFA